MVDSQKHAAELLDIDSSFKLESWLKGFVSSDIFEDESYWRNVGNLRSNAGSIEASADEINPLVERVVNAIEAVIELRVAEFGRQPENPREAIETLFDIPQGESWRLDETQAQKLAQDVVLTFKGDQQTPTVEVRDNGIGIHPTEFADTIVALGQSEKGQRPYLIGMYGQGGSSTFDKSKYTVIISRRHPDQLNDSQADVIGWTVVRKRLNVRAMVYSYLVDPDTDSIPTIPGEWGSSMGFVNGTNVLHVGYADLGSFAKQQITNNAYYTLNYRLFDPLLPWTLRDRRGAKQVSRTMRGVPYRLRQLPSVSGIGSSETRRRNETTAVRDHVDYRHEPESGPTLKVEWWILQDEQIVDGRRRREHYDRLRPYRDQTQRYSRRVTSVTRGGQTHAALTIQLFRNRGLHQLARSTIIHVDTDKMTWEEGAGFFTSNRADLKTESQRVVEAAVSAAIELHIDRLRAIERERQQEIVMGRSASDEEQIRQHLDKMIEVFRSHQDTKGTSTVQPGGRRRDFVGRQEPTFLKFAQTNRTIRPGVQTRVDLLTDADDEVVSHNRTEVRVRSSNTDGVLVDFDTRGGNGRYRVNLTPAVDLVVGTRIELSASITQPGRWAVEAKHPCRLTVAESPRPYEGTDPPTQFAFASQNGAVHVRRSGARIKIKSDARDDIIEKGAVLNVVSPDSESLPVLGTSAPKEGEFRVRLSVPVDAPLGPAGEISAKLTLKDGSELATQADLVIDDQLRTGGANQRSRPNYQIRDVRKIPNADGEVSWSDMPKVLDGIEQWNEHDVGAYFETGEENERQITFFVNADNKDLLDNRKQIARNGSQLDADGFRTMHRTLVCFHLYRLAVSGRPKGDTEYEYREEMIRLNQTLIYTHREFIAHITESHGG